MKAQYYFNSVSEEEKKEAKKYISSKLVKWDKFFKKMKFPPKMEVRIEFLTRKKRYSVGMELGSAIGKIVSKSEKQDMLEAIDEVLKEMRIQFRRNKEKLITLNRRGGVSLKKGLAIDKSARFRMPGRIKKRINRYWRKYLKP